VLINSFIAILSSWPKSRPVSCASYRGKERYININIKTGIYPEQTGSTNP
jgi:hypothetical protein